MAELSVRYAVALYELSVERGMLDEYLEQAAFLRDTLRDGEFRGIIGGPHITATEKRDFLGAAFDGKIHDDLLGFLNLAIAKGRESFLSPALSEFISMGERHKGHAKANVVSAVELDKEQVSLLGETLSRKLGKNVEINQRVDPSLIGGFYVNVDGYCIDKTVRAQLKDMKASIKRGAPDDSKA